MNVLSRGERARPTPATVKARFHEAGLEVAEEFLDGIARNLAVLQDHAATLEQFDPKADHWLMEGRHG